MILFFHSFLSPSASSLLSHAGAASLEKSMCFSGDLRSQVVGLDVNHALACFYDTHHMTPGCQGQEFVD